MGEIIEASIESLGRQHNLQCSGLYPGKGDVIRMPTRGEVMAEIGESVGDVVVDVQNRIVGVVLESGLFLPVEPEVFSLSDEEAKEIGVVEGVVRVSRREAGAVLAELRGLKVPEFMRDAYAPDTFLMANGELVGLRVGCGGVIPVIAGEDDGDLGVPAVEAGWSPGVSDRLFLDPAVATELMGEGNEEKMVRGIAGHLILQLG